MEEEFLEDMAEGTGETFFFMPCVVEEPILVMAREGGGWVAKGVVRQVGVGGRAAQSAHRVQRMAGWMEVTRTN